MARRPRQQDEMTPPEDAVDAAADEALDAAADAEADADPEQDAEAGAEAELEAELEAEATDAVDGAHALMLLARDRVAGVLYPKPADMTDAAYRAALEYLVSEGLAFGGLRPNLTSAGYEAARELRADG